MHSDAEADDLGDRPSPRPGPKNSPGLHQRDQGPRRPGPFGADPLEPYGKYLAARFIDDPHMWASALYDEVGRIGIHRLNRPAFPKQLRTSGEAVDPSARCH